MDWRLSGCGLVVHFCGRRLVGAHAGEEGKNSLLGGGDNGGLPSAATVARSESRLEGLLFGRRTSRRWDQSGAGPETQGR